MDELVKAAAAAVIGASTKAAAVEPAWSAMCRR